VVSDGLIDTDQHVKDGQMASMLLARAHFNCLTILGKNPSSAQISPSSFGSFAQYKAVTMFNLVTSHISNSTLHDCHDNDNFQEILVQ